MISGRLTTLFAFERFHHCPAASWGAAQQSLPVAVTVVNATAAERFRFAVVKLVFRAAMVRAVITAAQPVIGAVVAEPSRQRRRVLPVRQDKPRARRPFSDRKCGTDRRPRDASQESKPKGFHRPSTAREADQAIPERLRKSHPAIDGASIGAAGSTPAGGRCVIADARLIGSRMVKREPSPSPLFTSTPPPCRSTATLTR